MQGNTEVRKRLDCSIRTADGLLHAFMQLRAESDEHWEGLSQSVSAIGAIVCTSDYSKQLPEFWREQVMAFSKMRVQRGFAYLADLVVRTPLYSLANYRDWRAQVKLMHEAIEQERAFTKMCEEWLDKQKRWRYEHG